MDSPTRYSGDTKNWATNCSITQQCLIGWVWLLLLSKSALFGGFFCRMRTRIKTASYLFWLIQLNSSKPFHQNNFIDVLTRYLMVFCIVIYVIHLLTGMYERFSQDVLPIWCDNLIPDRLDMGTIHERLVRVRIYLESFRFLKYAQERYIHRCTLSSLQR